MGLFIDQSPHVAEAQPTPADDSHRAPLVVSKTRNVVGCVKEVVADKWNGPHLSQFADLYTRPPNLDVEKLSDTELVDCGISPRGAVAKLPRSSPDYQDWLDTAKAELKGRGATLHDLSMEPPPHPGSGPPPHHFFIPYSTNGIQ
jgi:hypothetical protein